MTASPATPSPEQRLMIVEAQLEEALHECETLRNRARTLNLEVRVRDQRIADLEQQVASLDQRLMDGAAAEGEHQNG